MHVLGSCEASAQYSAINFFVNLFHSQNSNLPHCFSDLIHTEYRKLHKNNGHSPFFLPPIMRLSEGQCRNIRFRLLYASHVIITNENNNATTNNAYPDAGGGGIYPSGANVFSRTVLLGFIQITRTPAMVLNLVERWYRPAVAVHLM